MINRSICRRLRLILLFGAVSASLPSAHSNDTPLTQLKKQFRKPKTIPDSKDNPTSPYKVNLGKILFFEPRLSGSNMLSCASCHNPSLSWTDGLPKAVGNGHKRLQRKTPTILNMAWLDLYFWDGRAGSLEEQALCPIGAEGEMNMKFDTLIQRLEQIPGYAELFHKAFPGEKISKEVIAKALAAFERTVVSTPAPFDQWILGNENAISPAAKRGFSLFNGKAKCVTCHSGWNFTDGSFHDIGVADSDIGRGKVLPKLKVMQHAFKTPTLRDIARRAPYMHDGSERTLQEVIEFYNLGGKSTRSSKSEDIQPLKLSSSEKQELIEFLKTLTSIPKPFEVPLLPN